MMKIARNSTGLAQESIWKENVDELEKIRVK